MTCTQVEPQISAADREAGQNWHRNRAALEQSQPGVARRLTSMPGDVEWIFARDGSLTGMIDGKWWTGCSVPARAGEALLASLEPSNLHHCFLSPSHGGLLKAARSRLGDEAAMVAIIPDSDALAILLCTDDFSNWISARKLWFVGGETWQEDMRRLFDEQPGLSTPARFIRTKLLSDEQANPMIVAAQSVFSAVLSDRAARIQNLQNERPSFDAERILVLAGSTFRMWDDAAEMLVDELRVAEADLQRFDCDDPASSSPLALALAARKCGAVVAANVSRNEAANLFPKDRAWITWITRPNIPSFAAAGPRDVLLLADPAWRSTAQSAGWPEARLFVAPWPTFKCAQGSAAASPVLAVVADTQMICIPKAIEDLSSHRLLWERIRVEMRDNPLVIGDDVIRYIETHAKAMDIAVEQVDRRGFTEHLIVPAYQQGLARLLMKAGVGLRLHGRGWDEMEEFRPAARGPVKTREEFYRAIGEAQALVDVWPTNFHAERLGKPIVRPNGRRNESFIRAAKLALAEAASTASKPSETNLGKTILNLVRLDAVNNATIAAA